MKELDSQNGKMKHFLWNMPNENNAKARIGCDEVCKPKNKGSLGFLDLVD